MQNTELKKPVELLEYLIKTYTNEGEIVVDNCMGSGSTCVACVNTNRNFIGIEIEEKYFDIAKERTEEATKNRGSNTANKIDYLIKDYNNCNYHTKVKTGNSSTEVLITNYYRR